MLHIPPFREERLQYSSQAKPLARNRGNYVTKLPYYFTIPEFSIENTWRGSSEILRKYYYSLEKNFSILEYLSIVPDGNYILCVSWKLLNIFYRYSLWYDITGILYVPSYDGRTINKDFYLEIWSTDHFTIEGGGTNLKLSQFKIPVSLCESGEVNLAPDFDACNDMIFNLSEFNPSLEDHYAVINTCLDTELILGPTHIVATLLEYWTLEEENPRVGKLLDSQLLNNPAVPTIAGKIGNAARFQAQIGDNGYFLYCEDALPEYGATTAGFSISFWTKFISFGNSGSEMCFLDYRLYSDFYLGDFKGHIRLDYYHNTELFSIVVNDNEDTEEFTIDFTVELDTWYHIFFYYNTITNKFGISINNASIIESDFEFTLPLANNKGFISLFNDTSNLLAATDECIVDEYGIWNGILSPAKRILLYNSGDGITWPEVSTI